MLRDGFTVLLGVFLGVLLALFLIPAMAMGGFVNWLAKLGGTDPIVRISLIDGPVLRAYGRDVN